jgi:hypothetical protein
MAATLKLCLNQGGKTQLRRTRVKSLAEFNYSHLQALVAEVFPEVPLAGVTFGYEDDESEFVTIASDRDLLECYEVMEPEKRKALRIIINAPGDDENTGVAQRRGVWRVACVGPWPLGRVGGWLSGSWTATP